ncbi:hypothetical protein L2E82_03661 [Cichorium intybus]|uniref:Uncharacterized protein n=1 Tax=Cichorium intybus TaxID=13427 RepID=A0ACB9H5E6_CICIN|nr:hypothetical protein L2E82_03661 [Cichorium intybus]
MVFGKASSRPEDNETEPPDNIVDLEENEEERPSNSAGGSQRNAEKDATIPLLEEVTIVGSGTSKNAGGAKIWVYNHCKVQYTSSYTRIHTHFFGTQDKKKAEIRRCPAMLNDKEKLQRLSSKVKEAESGGVSKALKNSLLTRNTTSKKRLEEAFGVMERTMVDMKIIRGLCANGLPFNVLRNPQFIEMINAIKKSPDGYKPPSSEKARTVLLDECVRDIDKDLIQVKDTWYTQGVSLISDGWTNVKHKPLINVLAVNARGAVFMYAEDYSGVETTGVEISKFLIGAIETVGASNVLQVVTDNAANCKAAGREIEKEDVQSVLAITKLIFLLIKFCDGEGPKIGEIYEKMDNMLGEIKDIMKENPFSSYYSQVEKIILTRWEKMNIPLHCLGFALTPRFYDKHYLQKMAPGGMQRKPPNLDKEVVLGVMEAFRRISEDEEEERVLREQFVTFHMKKGIYSMAATQADAVTMDGIDWWSTYGAETPELAEVAKKVLSQPISSSSAERNWSTYSYIHNVKRNRLNEKRADKLVYIHSNIRLLSRFSNSYKSGPHKKWDINPESTYIEGSSSRLKDMVWENLDEEDVENGQGKRPRVD